MRLSANSKRWLFQGGVSLIGGLLSVLLGWFAVRGTAWESVSTVFRQFPLTLIFLTLVVLLASGYLRAVRWRILWTDVHISTFRLFLIENAGLGLNNLSPIRAMDEPFEFGILTLRDRLPGGSVLATMMMSRVQDLAFTLIFVTISVITLPSLLKFTPAIFFMGIFFAAWLVVLLNLGRLAARFPRLRALPGVDTFERTVNLLWKRKRVVLASFTFTAAYWLLLGPAGWLIARGVGIELPFFQIMASVLGAIFFSTALPGLPGAVGTFEFAVVSLLDIWGVQREIALSFAVILHAFLFLPSTLITIVVLPREGIASITALRDIMRRGQSERSVSTIE